MAHDLLHLRLVLLDAQLGVLLLEVLHDLGHAALALALELPAARELDAAPAARLLGGLVWVLGDVDVRDRELVALLERPRGDERELGRAGCPGRARGGVTGMSQLDEKVRRGRQGRRER